MLVTYNTLPHLDGPARKAASVPPAVATRSGA